MKLIGKTPLCNTEEYLKDRSNYDGPDYNKISPEDSIDVKKAKLLAQDRWIENLNLMSLITKLDNMGTLK